MKKVLMIALVLLTCACCFVSCAEIEQEVGKKVSGMLLEYYEDQILENNPNANLRHLSQEEIDDLIAEYRSAGIELEGEITDALLLSAHNELTGEWGMQLSIGLSCVEDGEAIRKYYNRIYASEIEEGTAVINEAGFFVALALSSEPIPVD